MQPSPASTARARLTSSRWAAGLGILQPTLYPLLAPPMHPHTQWLPDTPNPRGCSGTPSSHSLVMGLPRTHSLFLADTRLGDVAPVTSLCPPPPRAPSTGALMTEPWTLGTPGTSPRALRASRTTWTRRSPSLPTATTAMRGSISSRVRGAAPLLLAEPGTTGHRQDTPLLLPLQCLSPTNALLVLS